MKFLSAVLAAVSLVLPPAHASKAVFAHFLVSNAAEFTLYDWQSDIRLAQAAEIDAFVLNVAATDPANNASLALAFKAAEALSFHLFFSFDYNTRGAWKQDDIVVLLRNFTSSPAYFRHEGNLPLVSALEGAKNAADWVNIKKRISGGLFFVPNWASLDVETAVKTASGVVDGLFNFRAWPNGTADMTTDVDRSYLAALGRNQVYMMAVSPWFYANQLGFRGQNWLWQGDGLWDLRWQQVLDVSPDYVQILTWNDFGESSYVGPLREKELRYFKWENDLDSATGVSHDGWRKFLPYYVDMYKTGGASGFVEGIMTYYRTAPARACPAGIPMGNATSKGQAKITPTMLMDDSVFYAALLESDATVSLTVSIGGKDQAGGFNGYPAAGHGQPGIYTGSVPFAGYEGDVVVTIARDQSIIATARYGKPLSTKCEAAVQNWNPVAI